MDHAPGSWTAERDPCHYHSLTTVTSSDGLHIAVGGWLPIDKAEAATRMIAAVPDLLDAAQALIADVRSRYPGEALRCPHMIALDAAIAKSTGAS